MRARGLVGAWLVMATGWLMVPWASAAGQDLEPLVRAIQAVGPNAAGHREAAEAWDQLARVDAGRLPEVLAAMDQAGPLAANWLATAADAIAERCAQQGRQLPEAELEEFVLDRRHAPRARRLAYEWLVRVDRAAPDRLLDGMLDDPSLELRRDAVARVIDQAQRLATAGKAAEATAAYQRALGAALDLDQTDLVADRLRKAGQTVDLARQLGHIVRWKLIGPFDNAQDKGFDAVYAPEREVQFEAAYPGKAGLVRWVDVTTDGDRGKVDFNKAFGEQKAVVGYAAAEFHAADRQEVELRMTSMNATRLWLNGKPVAVYHVYHSGSQPDQYVNRVVLEPGKNLILVKVCQNEQTQEWARVWGFQLRVTDAKGSAILSTDRT